MKSQLRRPRLFGRFRGNQAPSYSMPGRLISATFCALCLILSLPGCQRKTETSSRPNQLVETMNRGVSLMGQYEYDGASRAFAEVLQIDRTLVEAKVNLAIALFNRNRKEDQDLDRSGALLEEVLQQKPDHLRALYFRSIILQHIGKAEEAIPILENVTQKSPEDGAAWYVLALCKSRLGQPAEKDFLRALQCRPYLYGAYYQLYQSSMRAGQQDKAQVYLNQFKKLRENPLGETIELPQYNQMGDLALAKPMAAQQGSTISSSRFETITPQTIYEWHGTPQDAGKSPLGLAYGDLNGDRLSDLVLVASTHKDAGNLVLLKQSTNGTYIDATANDGMAKITNAVNCALGDFDNDGITDIFVGTAGAHCLRKGETNGIFTDAAVRAGFMNIPVASRSSLFLDADHDGDLDLLICNQNSDNVAGSIELWNNNGDGIFTNITTATGLFAPGCVMALPGDVDGDRDLDLVLLRHDQPAKLFLNELLGAYRETNMMVEARGDAGVLQDLNGDGLLDLLVLGGNPSELNFFLGDGHGGFAESQPFAELRKTAASWGPMRSFRIADLDLDGDLDVLSLGKDIHGLYNDGQGRFVWRNQLIKVPAEATIMAFECFDSNNDFVPDFLYVEKGRSYRIVRALGKLTPPPSALAIGLSGIRSRDGRTRSSASGYGATAIVRAGLRESRFFYSGQTGGSFQSSQPVLFGLGNASKADYVSVAWPDGVAQVEMNLTSQQTHTLTETQRKISSCPVLFAWNGGRFEFVTDFAGVGGLGYFAAPGVTAPPQVLEHIKIEAKQLLPKEGYYEVRITEPMEESAYIDRLELQVIDHPANIAVYPEEHLAINGPPPTHELLAVDHPIFALKALNPSGLDCASNLLKVDRIYAYDPPLDRRFIGFCLPHTLELDFGDQLANLKVKDALFLFLHGFIEYPYSQTIYAASQAQLSWNAVRIDQLETNGLWTTIVPDGGAPGGMGRMWTIDLTGKLNSSCRKLRLTTNMELFYDQIFLARNSGLDRIRIHKTTLADATLRKVGFAREYSPDGKMPLIFDYELSDASASFHALQGDYTRYGSVNELLSDFDDRYVIMGPGDELALRFDATHLPQLPNGYTRSFVLVSHAYCKDMDLYTATPQTIAPLPFQGMSRYPYPDAETYPNTVANRKYRESYNTRVVGN